MLKRNKDNNIIMELINLKNDEFYEEFCKIYYLNPTKEQLTELINEHKSKDKSLEDTKISEYNDFNNKQKEYNENEMLLKRCNQVLDLVELYNSKLKKDIIPIKKGFEILTKEHKEKFLITEQLHEVIYFIEGYILREKLDIEIDDEVFIYDYYEGNPGELVNKADIPVFNLEKIRERLQNKFRWKYSDNDILDIVRKEVDWRDVERDISIYKERKKGVLVRELAKIYNMEKGSISRITKKVRGKINYIKGHLFESEYKKYLKDLGFYDKVDNIGTSGQPDILCYKENIDQLDVYSLKMLKIRRKGQFIPKKELTPEYKIAYDKSFSYTTVNLYLVVFNYLNNKVETKTLNWEHPENITIKQLI